MNDRALLAQGPEARLGRPGGDRLRGRDTEHQRVVGQAEALVVIGEDVERIEHVVQRAHEQAARRLGRLGIGQRRPHGRRVGGERVHELLQLAHAIVGGGHDSPLVFRGRA